MKKMIGSLSSQFMEVIGYSQKRGGGQKEIFGKFAEGS
jgi:hypothetical protein